MMSRFALLFVLLLLVKGHAGEPYRYQLAICAIFQDEAPYLKEWIEFHKLMGVEHFYLYNHRSRDNYLEVLTPYLQTGLVELNEKPKVANRIKVFNRLQCQCYTECLQHALGTSKWVAFIDIDEFLYPVKEQKLLDVLKNYEDYGGVAVNWHVFGTSQLNRIVPNQLMIEQLTSCCPKSYTLNRYVKSIVRPERASHFLNPHHPVYREGFCQVNTDRIPTDGPFFSSYVQANRLKINHYWTRDETFFYQKKIPRQKRWGGQPTPKEILIKLNEEKDETILRFAPALKMRMKH